MFICLVFLFVLCFIFFVCFLICSNPSTQFYSGFFQKSLSLLQNFELKFIPLVKSKEISVSQFCDSVIQCWKEIHSKLKKNSGMTRTVTI